MHCQESSKLETRYYYQRCLCSKASACIVRLVLAQLAKSASGWAVCLFGDKCPYYYNEGNTDSHENRECGWVCVYLSFVDIYFSVKMISF